jgi:hypothetical protein
MAPEPHDMASPFDESLIQGEIAPKAAILPPGEMQGASPALNTAPEHRRLDRGRVQEIVIGPPHQDSS